jgi:hypothetical protein
MPTSSELLLQDLKLWIRCRLVQSQRETAERIEQKWPAEFDAYLTTGEQSLHSREGLQMLSPLEFPFHDTEGTEHDSSRNKPTIPNDQDEEITRTQAQWISDAAK